jgi:tetratricopeptide (TPR) repeat protein
MSTNRASAHLFFSLVMVCCVCRLGSSAESSGDFDRALAEFRGGNYAQAAEMFAHVDTAAPGTTDALLYRAKALVHLQDFAAAEKALRGYLQSHRDSADALYMLGFVLNRENRPADSLVIYTQAAAITRPTADDLKIVGLDYVLLDDYGDAINWLEKAVALDSKNKDAWYYLGRAYYTKSRLGEARKAFHTVLDLDPFNAKAENNLGLILETEGQPAAAMEAYRKAIAWQEQNSQISEQPYVNLGNLLAEQGRPQEAAEPLKKAVALAPNNAFCHMTLGIYYRKAGQMKQAQSELLRATELEPNNAVAHYQLGRLYKDINDLPHAKAEFDRTAELQGRTAASPRAPKIP